ncbi:MAG: PilZ domain-containing protein [Acidobacteriaceae bacterium]|nr:PilZ domain-containing protein [Acidobacteriaceae bacterium]
MCARSLSKRSEAVVGAGKTINVSSSGALFTSEHELANGTRLQVFMHWPVKLNEKRGLNLVGTGRVVRHAKG